MSVVSSERYQKELMDVHNPGVLVVPVGEDQQCYSSKAVRSLISVQAMLYLMVVTLALLAPPALLYITWRKQLAALQQVKVTKGGPTVMWACIVWMPLANLYFTVKSISSISHFAKNMEVQMENDIYIGLILEKMMHAASSFQA